MAVRALGPLAIIGDGPPALLRGSREAGLLAMLVAERNHVVSADRLADELWGSANDSIRSLRVAITRLRQRFARETDADPIRTAHRGYKIELDATSLDLARYEEVVQRGLDGFRRGLDAVVSAAFGEAEALWTGQPFEGIVDLAMVDDKRRALQELRDDLAQARAVGLINAGAPDEARRLLEPLLNARPFRENLWGLAAISLYAQRRQADALDRLSILRRRLRDDLGILPSAEVQQLELDILNQAPLELAGRDFLGSARLSRGSPPGDANGASLHSQNRATRVKLRTADSLVEAGVLSEAAVLIEDAEQEARLLGDTHLLASALASSAELLTRRREDPTPVLDELQRLARDMEDGTLMARAALARFASGMGGDRSVSLTELLEPVSLLTDGDALKLRLVCAAAANLALIDGSPAARQLLVAANRIHLRQGSEQSECLVLATRSVVNAIARHPIDDVVDDAQRAFDMARRLDEPALIVAAGLCMLRRCYAQGLLGDVDRVLDAITGHASSSYMPNGAVRVQLCRATNAIARGQLEEVPGLIETTREYGRGGHAYLAETASAVHQILLDREADRTDAVLAAAQQFKAATSGANVWDALIVLYGDVPAGSSRLASIIPDVPLDDRRTTFFALSAEVAAREQDPQLGELCAEVLEPEGDLTVLVGLGTPVLGFSCHYAGLARTATGQLDAAVAHLTRARSLAESVGAGLWLAHSELALARALTESGHHGEAASVVARLTERDVARQSARVRRGIRELGGTTT